MIYIADAEDNDLKWEVTFPADSFNQAIVIANKRGWVLIGELLETAVVPDSFIDSIVRH